MWRVAREIQQGKDERTQASTDKVPVVEYKHHSREVNHSLQSNVDTLPVLSFRFLRYLELKGLCIRGAYERCQRRISRA